MRQGQLMRQVWLSTLLSKSKISWSFPKTGKQPNVYKEIWLREYLFGTDLRKTKGPDRCCVEEHKLSLDLSNI